MPNTILARLRPLVAIALLALLALPATAAAKPRDRNRDGIPDKWAKKHRLSTKKRIAGKDNDRDGLKNLTEYRAKTNPRRADSDRDGTPDAGEDRDRDRVDNGNEQRERTNAGRRDTDRDGIGDGREDRDRDRLRNAAEDAADTDPIDADSDDDGVKDGNETAGRVIAFDGKQVELRLFTGIVFTAAVDEDTEVACGYEDDDSGWSDDDESADEDDSAERRALRGGLVATYDEDEDESDDDESDDDEGEDDSDDSEDDESDDDEDWDEDYDELDCSIEDIRVGSVVREASLQLTSHGAYFEYLELAE